MCFDVGIFTNLTPEHLDYHITMKDYFEAKKRLFLRYLKPGSTAVINIDDSYGKRLKEELLSAGIDTEAFTEHPKYPAPATIENVCKTHKILTYGFDISSHCYPTTHEFSLEKTHLCLKLMQSQMEFKNSLIGKHNAYNMMAAVCAARCLNVPFENIVRGIEKFKGIAGRLQRVPGFKDINVFIDYAHTPDALEKVLTTLKPNCSGRLILVFGCGGNRDKSKRSKMGHVASRYSTNITITNDNPRNENPENIIIDILEGIPQSLQCRVIADRREAILTAITDANPHDTVLIAGKGHEEFQEIKNKKFDFSDYLVCQETLMMRKALLYQAV